MLLIKKIWGPLKRLVQTSKNLPKWQAIKPPSLHPALFCKMLHRMYHSGYGQACFINAVLSLESQEMQVYLILKVDHSKLLDVLAPNSLQQGAMSRLVSCWSYTAKRYTSLHYPHLW